jgi:hypothetical protein
MWMDYSQVWRAEHEQTTAERRAADEQLGRLAADLSHIWHDTVELASTLVARTGRWRRQRQPQPQPSGGSPRLSCPPALGPVRETVGSSVSGAL